MFGKNDHQPEKLSSVIELEKQLGAQIYNALQGQVVEEVLSKISNNNSDAYWRSSMEGHSLKVDKELLPEIYELTHEVMRRLNYTDKVDFYITGDSTVNAFSLASESPDTPHIININSALFDLMTRDELCFVIGHELGHLINKDTALQRLIMFVFPQGTEPPLTLQYKIRLHSQLAELVADRYGYLATQNLEACVTAFFKMASGLDLAKMHVSMDALLEDNTRRLDYFLKGNGISRATHPVNPIRVHALKLFSTCQTQAELDKEMDKLIAILLKVGDGELDEHLARFIASAGLITITCDNDVHDAEVTKILENLSSLKIFPRQFLDEIAQCNVTEIFQEAVTNILKINPGMRNMLLDYMISLVLADRKIEQSEVELLYNFGDFVGMSEIEVANAIASAIQRSFVPDINTIC